jgi:hypothetical protein
MDASGLQRFAAAVILGEIEKVRSSEKRYKPRELIDWCYKLARVAQGYTRDDNDRSDFADIRPDLRRLNPEQLLALKQLVLIASGGASVVGGGSAPLHGPAPGPRRGGKQRPPRDRTRTDP